MPVSFESVIKGPLQNVNAELLTAAINGRCQKYLTQRSSQISAAQLKVIVHSAAVDELRLSDMLKLGLEGQVNDAPVRINAGAQRTAGNHGEKSMHRLLHATERLLAEAPTERQADRYHRRRATGSVRFWSRCCLRSALLWGLWWWRRSQSRSIRTSFSSAVRFATDAGDGGGSAFR